MRRRLFKFAFIFSAVLTIGLSILCIRSLWIADAWGWSYDKRSWQCGLAGGRLRLDTTLFAEEGGSWPHPSLAHVEYSASVDPPTKRLPPTIHNLGFALEHKSQPHNYTSSLILIPMWALIVITLTAAESLRRLARRALHNQRRKSGLCPSCGYDTRATPGSCPECGAGA